MDSPSENAFSQWKALLERPLDSATPAASITGIVKACMAAAAIDPALMDYSRLNPKRCSALGLASSLRCAFGARALVPTWESGLLMAIDSAAREGLDARALLRGML